jgi:hypothetical protein
MSRTDSKKVRFIKPPNIFKKKVGAGGISELLLEKSQEAIDNVEVDFTPYAQDFLKQITEAIALARSQNNLKDAKEKLIRPVMQLKANGGMFRYHLLSDIANTALQFLEDIDELNDDAYDVIKAHENTLKIIVSTKLVGNGGAKGGALIKELQKACQRYHKKYGNLDEDV